MPEEQKPELNWEEWRAFMRESIESHDNQIGQLIDEMRQLRELSDRNEKRWGKLNNAIYAAALQYFKPEGEGEKGMPS